MARVDKVDGILFEDWMEQQLYELEKFSGMDRGRNIPRSDVRGSVRGTNTTRILDDEEQTDSHQKSG